MRICHVTTYWPTNRIGHTHYTDALIEGIRRHQPERHYIAGRRGADLVETDTYTCVPCFGHDEDYVTSIRDTVRQFEADVALFQYSPDLFGNDNRLPRLLERLKQDGVVTVVNAHSIYPTGWRTGFRPGRNAGALDRALGQAASCMMVHSTLMRQDLIERGVDPNKIAVIPHGSRPMEARDPAQSRRTLGIPEDAKVVLFFGFIWLGKGLDFLLDVFARVARRVPDAYLYIGGYTRHKKLYTQAYMAYLRARLQRLGIAKRTSLWGDFVPDEMVPSIYSAADVVAMPYRQSYSSVSGVVHQTAGSGRLMLCSQISKFYEVEHAIAPELVVGPSDREGWTLALVRLLEDADFAARMREKILAFAAETSWEAVGKMHLALYQDLRAGRAPSVNARDQGTQPASASFEV